MLLRRWLENWPVETLTLSPDSITCTGTLSPDGKSITQPLVSAVAVSVYFVTDVSFPDSGVATTAHLPAKSARVTAGAGAGAGAAAAAFVVSAACSLLPHA